MCGRFEQSETREYYAHALGVDTRGPEWVGGDTLPRYNLSPGQWPVVLHLLKGTLHSDYVPWGYRTPEEAAEKKKPWINARIERALNGRYFRHMFREGRVIIPAGGWFEWLRHEVACVIVRRSHPVEPAAPSLQSGITIHPIWCTSIPIASSAVKLRIGEPGISFFPPCNFNNKTKGNEVTNKRMLIALASAVVIVATNGCATSKMSSAPMASHVKHNVSVIALAPGGGMLTDAVGVELANRGFTIIDPSSTSNMMVRLNLNEVEISRPEGLAKLKDQGIDAFLIVRAAGGYDQQPQSASARMNSTHNGKLLAGITWQNGYGGRAGSIADRTMRKGLSEAAIEIATALSERVQ